MIGQYTSPSDQKSAYLCLLIAPFFWAGNIVLGRGFYEQMPPVAISFWRWTIALIVLFLLDYTNIINQKDLIQRKWKELLWLGITGAVGFNTMTYYGLNYTTANNTVLMNSLSPIFILLISALAFRQKLQVTQILGCVISFLGLVIIMGMSNIAWDNRKFFNNGDLWVLGAVISWSLYTVSIKNMSLGFSPTVILAAMLIVSLPFLLPFYIWEMLSQGLIQPTFENILVLAYFGVLPSVLSYLLWNKGVEKIGPVRAGIFIHLVPIYGVGLSAIFLGEALHGHHAIGGLLIFFGILIVAINKDHAKNEPIIR